MNLHITFPLYKLEWPEAQEVKWCPAKLTDGWLSILTLSSVSLSGDEGFSLPALSHLDLRTERREQVVNRGLTPPAHPGLSVFSSSCWLRTGEGKVWICSHICEPAASDRWEWDVVTDASMWRCIFSLCQNSKKANCQAHIKLKIWILRIYLDTNRQWGGRWFHALSQCATEYLTLSVCQQKHRTLKETGCLLTVIC